MMQCECGRLISAHDNCCDSCWDKYVNSPQYEADKEKSRRLTLRLIIVGTILALIWLACNLQ